MRGVFVVSLLSVLMLGALAGSWLRLGVWLWACRRFSRQDPARLWAMSAGKHVRLSTPSAWYAEQNQRFSTPRPGTGG